MSQSLSLDLLSDFLRLELATFSEMASLDLERYRFRSVFLSRQVWQDRLDPPRLPPPWPCVWCPEGPWVWPPWLWPPLAPLTPSLFEAAVVAASELTPSRLPALRLFWLAPPLPSPDTVGDAPPTETSDESRISYRLWTYHLLFCPWPRVKVFHFDAIDSRPNSQHLSDCKLLWVFRAFFHKAQRRYLLACCIWRCWCVWCLLSVPVDVLVVSVDDMVWWVGDLEHERGGGGRLLILRKPRHGQAFPNSGTFAAKDTHRKG